MNQCMVLEQTKLEYEPTSFTIIDLKKAASNLNLVSYGRYKAHQYRVSEYAAKVVEDHVAHTSHVIV